MTPTDDPGCIVFDVDFHPCADVDDIGLRVKRREFTACKHSRQTVDETLRAVHCRDCDAQLDPVEVILGWARTWERMASSVMALRSERDRLTREIDELKRERANLRAQVRRGAR